MWADVMMLLATARLKILKKKRADIHILHTSSNTTPGNFVSTTANQEIANQFAKRNGYVYVIDTNNYIDINKTYGNMWTEADI